MEGYVENINIRKMMIDGVQNELPQHDFLEKTFISGKKMHETTHVEWDKKVDDRAIAKFVSRDSDGILVQQGKFDTYVTQPAYIFEKMMLTPEMASDRAFSVNQYQQMSNDQRIAIMVAEMWKTLRKRAARKREQMVAEAIYTGKVQAVGVGVNGVVDFNYTADNFITLSGTGAWDGTDSDPFKDLDKWCLARQKKCGKYPNKIIVSHDVAHVFLDHPKVVEYMERNRQDVVDLEPELLSNGVSRVGKFRLYTGTVTIYIYNEWYDHPDTGVLTPMVPNGTVLLGYSGNDAQNELHYGFINNFKANLRAMPEFPNAWISEDGRKQFITLESASMVALRRPELFTIAHVLNNPFDV
ncbi:MAG: major capsid protein [Candidatus Cloacimonetes bacterium]|nr:major capsid protein [Candidatus Cloacimonadota bacterium]